MGIAVINKVQQNNTVTKADLANAVYLEIELTKLECSQLVDSILEKIELSLVLEGTVKLSGFGNFVTRLKPKRMGRNPKTGKIAVISPRRTVTFKPSPKLTERVDAAHLKSKNNAESLTLSIKTKRRDHGKN